MDADEDSIEAVEKVLKEPVAAGFNDQGWRIRNNLIITSAIGLVMALAELKIRPDSSFLGLRFEGLTDILVRWAIAGIIVYLLFHFLWVAWDAFLEWRLRITGTRSAFQTGSFFTNKHADYPVDPRQSTLYNWWANHQRSIGQIGDLVAEIKERCEYWDAALKTLQAEHPNNPQSQNLNNAIHGLTQVNNQVATLASRIDSNTKAMQDERIATSLRRFDRWFSYFLRSQNLRWLVVEFVAPVALAAYAFYALVNIPA